MPSWDTYVNWFLAIAMCISLIIYGYEISQQPKVEVTKAPGGGLCIGEYDYRVNRVCLYYKFDNNSYGWELINKTVGVRIPNSENQSSLLS